MRFQLIDDLNGPQRRIWYVPDAKHGTGASGIGMAVATGGEP